MGRISFSVVVAAVLLVAGCASPASTAPDTGSSLPSLNDLDPADAAFVAKLRSLGLAPVSSASFPDAAYITDANAVCQILALGEAPQIVKTDLTNMRKNRASGYDITTDQATQVMVLSAQTYCPARVATVNTALG